MLNIYSTSRNSAAVAFAWRHHESSRHMPPQFLELVQSHCAELMTQLGYEKFENEKDMFNQKLKSMKSQKEIQSLFKFE